MQTWQFAPYKIGNLINILIAQPAKTQQNLVSSFQPTWEAKLI